MREKHLTGTLHKRQVIGRKRTLQRMKSRENRLPHHPVKRCPGVPHIPLLPGTSLRVKCKRKGNEKHELSLITLCFFLSHKV